MLQRIATRLTHRIHELPVLVLMPHSRCNCRCVMCDIWKSNQEKKEITTEELSRHIAAFKKLGVKRVALSGGEALMHANLWEFCRQLNSIGTKISLLSTGITVKNHAPEIAAHCADLILSLDGSASLHNQIRNIPNAYERLSDGIKAVKKINPDFKITGRCVIQKSNYQDFANIVRAARDLGMSQISFLPADVSSSAFNRAISWPEEKKEEVALTAAETDELELILTTSFQIFKTDYEEKFITESPVKMLEIPAQYRAYLGLSEFPSRRCNAPWVSAVIEPNGDVLPCFFHKPYGNIYLEPFENVINSPHAIGFRRQLKIKQDPTCQRCVCALQVGPLQQV